MAKRTADDMIRDLLVGLEETIDQSYSIIGAELSEYMQDQVENFSEGTRLKSTITYATDKGVVGKTTAKDVPSSYFITPAEPGTLKIGTAAPFAKYVEYGALPFGEGIGSQDPAAQGTFNERITAWWCDELGHGRSQEQLDIARAWATSIVKNGTKPHPFLEPTKQKAYRVISSTLKGTLQKFGVNLQRKCKVSIEVDVDLKRGTKAG